MYVYLAIIGVMYVMFQGIVYLTKQHRNFEKRNIDDDYFTGCGINLTITGALVMFLVFFRESIFIKTFHPDIKTIIVWLILIDTVQYWFHRTTHRIPILRKILHEKHHDVFHLLPMDFLNLTVIEYSIYVFISNILPLFIFSINIYDYFIINIIVLIHQIYTHCQTNVGFIFPMFITSEYHRQHHQIGKGSYSPLFPFWDEYMGTRIDLRKTSENKVESKDNDGSAK